MENEFSTVMDDGRILQKDNAIFQGKELARVDPAEIEEALHYFTSQFADIEKYVDSRLESLSSEERSPEILQRLQQLRREVIDARAVGDFEKLVGKIDTMVHECEPQEVGGGKPHEEPPAESEPVKEQKADEAVAPEAVASEEASAPDSAEEPPAESEPVKDQKADEAVPGQEEDVVKPEKYPESLSGLAELAGKAVEATGGGSWQQMQSELDNIRFKWDQLLDEDAELVSQEGYQDLLRRLEGAQRKVAERKTEWLEKRRERRKDNMDKRAKIIDQLQDIIDRKKWQAFKQVGNLTSRWEDIKDVPDEPEAAEQQKKYDDLVREFNDKKVAFLVRKAQKGGGEPGRKAGRA
jgi:hypothetical protein